MYAATGRATALSPCYGFSLHSDPLLNLTAVPTADGLIGLGVKYIVMIPRTHHSCIVRVCSSFLHLTAIACLDFVVSQDLFQFMMSQSKEVTCDYTDPDAGSYQAVRVGLRELGMFDDLVGAGTAVRWPCHHLMLPVLALLQPCTT